MPAAKKTTKTAVKKTEKKAVSKKAPLKGLGKNLVIVESPTKEKTLSRFLGRDYVVKSSFGHLRDLPSKELGVDVANNFEPKYEIMPRGKKLIPDLKKLAASSPKVYLATDFDREGEAIAWHLSNVLDVEEERLYRITFHEITQEAILHAVENPRKIMQELVDAQQARRVLDRIVGYKLSPLLWEKVRMGLSAGRVQSVAVRLICEREDEIEAFKPEEYWSVEVELENTQDVKKIAFRAALVEWKGEKVQKLDVKNKEQADLIAQVLKLSNYSVKSIVKKEKRRNPLPPFMTSTLQQEASRKLGFAAQRTMRIAQSLYEGVQLGEETVGLITYMRTDSLNIAQSAQQEALSYVEKTFGKNFLPLKPRIYKTKAKGAQEAHEAIRPTSVFRRPEDLKNALSAEQLKLYNLIWQRFLASQMAEALYDTTTVEVQAQDAILRANGSVLKESGFLIVYGQEVESEDTQEKSDDSKQLPLLSQGEDLKYLDIFPEQHFTEAPPRFNEASLIKTLEQNGVGRPSTYATILETIISRGYVWLQEKRFAPTELGKLVNAQLMQHFSEVVDIHFTAKIEEEFDEVAEGKKDWRALMAEFYTPFEKSLSSAKENMQRVKLEPKDSGELCPNDGAKVLIKESRFGKYMACENAPECKYKVQLDINGQKVVAQISEEKCPKCDSAMAVKMSRRGKFLACTAYPKCKSTIGLDRQGNKVVRPEPKMTDKKCDKCGSGMLLRFGGRGPFLACSAFPKCRNIKSPEPEDVKE